MFKNNDRISLSLINARDANGNIIPFTLKLPLDDKEYKLPEELAAIDVFEYHEILTNSGTITFSAIAFNIYIGKINTIRYLSNEIALNNIKLAKNIQIKSIDTPVCTQNVSGKQIVFATLNEQDIIVENIEKLKEVIEQLSDNFNTINKSITNIRTLSKKK